MMPGYEIHLDTQLFHIETIRNWCKENIKPENYNLIHGYYFYTLILDEEDAMAFKLRWI